VLSQLFVLHGTNRSRRLLTFPCPPTQLSTLNPTKPTIDHRAIKLASVPLMERQRSQEPGAVQQSDPARVEWPQVPSNELPSSNGGHGDITLPDLKTVLSPQFQHLAPSTSDPNALSYGSPISTGSLPHIDPGRAETYSDGTRRSMDMGLASPTEAGSVRSEDDRGRARSAVPTDDDVRIAAEALSGLSGPGQF